jgi:hypothetical protein
LQLTAQAFTLNSKNIPVQTLLFEKKPELQEDLQIVPYKKGVAVAQQ